MIFLHHDFSSSDFTDESEGILAYRITHGISQNFGRWPMAGALYMLLLFFVTQISQMTQIFLSGRVLSHRFPQILDLFGLWKKNTQISQMTQFFCLDIWGIFLSIMARMNLCKSVESVGLLN